MPNLGGRPGNPARALWRLRFGLTPKQAADLNEDMLLQLYQCKDDEARLLLLGVSK